MSQIIVHTLIFNSKKEFLLLKRALTEKVLPGFWDIPGGTLRRYEDPLLGAIRETKEEAGIKIRNLKLFAYTANVDSKKREQFTRLIFRADYASGKIKLTLKIMMIIVG